MQHVAVGFNRLAPFYTLLSGLVFGKSLQRSQQHFISNLKPNDRVLILGGGSGDFLLALLKQHAGLSIDYIDISPNMIELAKKKTAQFANVNFIVGTEQNIPEDKYSVVITNFYLDLFPDQKLSQIIHAINKHMTAGAHWLVTDFVQEKHWQRVMLWMMYRFFTLTTGIEAKSLPDWQFTLEKEGFTETESKRFYRGFIKAAVYKAMVKA